MTGGLTETQTRTLATFDEVGAPGEPLTTSEVAERLDCTRRNAYGRLDRLADRGAVASKKVGARARVWWRPDGADDDGVGASDENDGADASDEDDGADATRGDGGAGANGERGGTARTDEDAVAALRRERRLVERILETTPVGIAVLEADRTVSHLNERAAELLGLDPDDAAAFRTGEMDLLDGSGEPVFAPTEAAFEVLETGEPVYGREVRVETESGEPRWLSINATPILDDDGAVERVVSAGENVTALKEQARRLERQRDDLRRELDEAFDRIDGGLVALDDEWRFTYVNERAAAVLPSPPGGLLGRPVHDVVPDVERFEGFEAVERAVETQQPVTTEFYAESLDSWLELEASPSESGVSVYLRDVTDRVERERRLERYERIVETVDDGIYVLDADHRFLTVNEGFAEMTGHEPEALVGERAETVFWDEFVDIADEKQAELATGDTDVASLEEPIYPADGEPFTVESRFSLFDVGDGETGRVGVVRDVSGRKRHEKTLTALYDSARALLAAESPGEVDEAVIEAAAGVLDLPGVAVYRHDPDIGVLFPAARSLDTGFMQDELVPTPADGDSIAAHVFATGEPLRLDDVTASEQLLAETAGTEMRGGLFVPVGDVGVVVVGSREVGGVDADVQRLVELVATNAEAAYDRVARERELARRREHLAALDDLNGVVRDIIEAVIEQSTREEIERTVCEALAAADAYEFAWIAGVDGATGTVQSRAEAGVDGYLDAAELSVDADDPAGQGPTGRALRTGETQVVTDLATDPTFEPWREVAESHGVRASAAIPVTHGGTLYGVLGVYADRPDAFTDAERDVVGQLGEVVGHAITAVDRRRALIGDEVVELDFTVRDLLGTVGADVDPAGRLTFDRLVPVDDEAYLEYGTVTEDGREVLDALVEAIPFWESVRVFEGDGGESRFELQLSEPPMLSTIADHGGTVGRGTLADGDLRMVVHLPPGVDVRQLTETVRETYPTAEMVSRRQRSGVGTTRADLERLLSTELTDRQRAALAAAFYAGFFEWPRDASGEDVAAALGVSPPTFHQHLRAAERRLFTRLFEAD